jgi:ribosomal protein L37AE/L43A
MEVPMSKETASHAAEANQLYWNSQASVGDIANQLGISRRALYELIEPQPTGVPCSECGTETAFANRSSHSAGLARCPSCGAETAMPAARVEHTVEQVQPQPVVKSNGKHAIPRGVTQAALPLSESSSAQSQRSS